MEKNQINRFGTRASCSIISTPLCSFEFQLFSILRHGTANVIRRAIEELGVEFDRNPHGGRRVRGKNRDDLIG